MPDDRAIRFLLSSSDPSVRFLTLTDILGRPPRAADVRTLRQAIPTSPRVLALLAGQRSDGGFGAHPYKKWNGAHWRLVSLVELGLPRRHPQALRAADQVLAWLHGPSHRGGIVTIRGRVRRCASQEGNALVEYRHETADGALDAAVERAADFFLRHRLFRSERTGRAFIGRHFAYPPYWHYDILTALRVFGRLGRLADPRVQEALDIVEAKRGRDELWRADVVYWKRGKTARHRDVVDWGRGSAELLTLNALRVLRAAGRLK